MSDQIEDTQVLSDEEQIASILENLPAETEVEVLVPSRGIPYFNKEKTICVRPMTFEDEKAILSGQRTKLFDPSNFLLSRCVKGVDINDLLIIDKLFLLLKIREISYGKDYKVGIICNHCEYENSLSLQIDKLNCTFVPEDLNVFEKEIFLDGIQKEAVVTAPTVCDENYLQAEHLQENLWRFIKSIEGNDNKTILAKVIEKLPIIDIHKVIKEITLADYGIQPQIRYVCDSCKTSNLINLPINENFFSVN